MTQPNPDHQVTLCHSGNGKHFSVITTDWEGALGHAHTDDDDIIPAFPGFLGQNLTVEGLYRLGHECQAPIITTTTTIQGDPEPTTTTTIVTTTTTLPTTTSTTTTTTIPATTTTTPETTTTLTLTAGLTTEAPTTTEIPAEAPVEPDMLPVTGAATSALLLAAVALVGTGSYLVRRFR